MESLTTEIQGRDDIEKGTIVLKNNGYCTLAVNYGSGISPFVLFPYEFIEVTKNTVNYMHN